MTMELNRTLILKAYKKAKKRILFLDYDGTLVPFSDLPRDSKLGKEIRNILINLSQDQKNRIYIISGRDRVFLTNQFRGLQIGLIAEHGYLVKEADRDWQMTVSLDNTWKITFSKLFQEFSLLYPGSFIEEKESSVAYHFRTADKKVGSKVRPDIRKYLIILQQQYPRLELLDGNKVYEIKPESFNKGKTASAILRKENFDFILAAGDDLTDEHLFAEFPHKAFTIKVGSPPTLAQFYISGQNEFIEFLKCL